MQTCIGYYGQIAISLKNSIICGRFWQANVEQHRPAAQVCESCKMNGQQLMPYKLIEQGGSFSLGNILVITVYDFELNQDQ